MTFLVTADTHFGAGNVEAKTSHPDSGTLPIVAVNDRALKAMGSIRGRGYPARLGGFVDPPRGVIVAGDITDSGNEDDWNVFVSRFGQLGFPTYEGIGNHDFMRGTHLTEHVVERHGSVPYSWDWGDLHLVHLGVAPDSPAALGWLERDLEALGPDIPVALFMHYPLVGPYSDNEFTAGGYRDRLLELLASYNVVGLFHGHFHVSTARRTGRLFHYGAGSPKNGWRCFLVVHVTDDRCQVVAYNYDLGAWWWWHVRPINGSSVAEAHGMLVPPGSGYSPLFELGE